MKELKSAKIEFRKRSKNSILPFSLEHLFINQIVALAIDKPRV